MPTSEPDRAARETYIAFLRGINVGGNSMVSMAKVKESLQGSGFTDVRTYINSGNVIFSAATADPLALADGIERALERDVGLPIKVLVLSRTHLERLVDAIPPRWTNDKSMRCDVMLLWKEIDDPQILERMPGNPAIEDVRYTPGAVVWRVDRVNVGRSGMAKIVGTPLYKQITVRNVNTVRKLLEMTS